MSEDKKSTDTPTTDTTKEQPMDKSIEKPIESEPSSLSEVSEPTEKEIEAEEKSEKKSKEGKKSKIIVFVLVLIIFLIAFFGGGYLAYLYLEKQNAERRDAQSLSLNSNLESVQQQLSDLKRANQNFQRSQSSLQTSLTALQSESERQMQALAQRISSNESTGVADWTLAEVEYLLNIANQRLTTNKDSQTAIQMLEQADSILFELAYPELTPVRRQISADLTALRLTNKVDTEGLYFELEALSSQLVGLADFSPEYIPRAELTEVEGEALHQKLWGHMTNALSKFVRVQTDAGEPEYLVSDEQAALRQLGVQLQLRQAQLALLSAQESVYQGALSSAATELNRYYANSVKAAAMSDRLSELSNISVNSDEMNINGSIRALSSVVDQLSKAGSAAAGE